MGAAAVRPRVLRLRYCVAGGLGVVVTLAGATAASSRPLPVTTHPGLLEAVSARSASDAWAVGFGPASGTPASLVLHWGGARWRRVASPSPGGPSGSTDLFGVSATSASNAWAVGEFQTASGPAKTLVLHWDGARWRQVASPNPGGAFGGALVAVSAVSRANAWAVGEFQTRSGPKTLVLHWNGARWRQVASPSPGVQGELSGISTVSGADAWAVGNYTTSSFTEKTLVLHWDGTRWRQVASPSPGGTHGSFLSGISARSASDAWAVGHYNTPAITQKTLVLHWDGASWAQVATPNPGGPNGNNGLFGVSATSASNAWAVGAVTSVFALNTLVLRWDGASWLRS